MAIRAAGGSGVREAYIPEIYSPVLKERLRDNCVLEQLANKEFTGKFRNKGDTIVIRKTPSIKRRRYVRGVPLVYQDPSVGEETHTISRSDYWAFIVNDIEKMLSDIPAFAAKWTREGALSMAEGREIEFFNFIPSVTDLAYRNKGNQAGIRTGFYKLGEALDPIHVFATEAAAAASTVTGKKNTMIDLISQADAALAEHKGAKGLRPWMVLPPWVKRLINTSELSNASFSGDAQTCLRKTCVSIGNLAGFDLYTSNLLPVVQDGSGKFTFTIPFGDESGITYADEISSTKMGTSETQPADWHRSVGVYDFFARQKERFGYMQVAKV